MTPQRQAPTTTSEPGRKWVPKSPIEVVIEQVTRQERKVSTLKEELAHEERELAKLQKARKVLEETA